MYRSLRKMWRSTGLYKSVKRGGKAERRTAKDGEKATAEHEQAAEAKKQAIQEEADFPLPLGRDPGTLFHDDYPKLGGVSSSGEFGLIRRAIRKDGLESAVTIIKPAQIDTKTLRHLRNEVRLLHELDHEHIIKLHGWYEEPEAYSLAQELCKGGEVFDHTANQDNYSEEQARDIVRELLKGVNYLHSQGIVLGNLRPEHLLLTDESDTAVLKISDLKYATRDCDIIDFGEQNPCSEYSAPEVVKGQPFGPPADMWSVGVIAYILVGGYLPFTGPTQVELLRNIRRGMVEFHEAQWKSTSPSVIDIIRRMLSVDPNSRLTAEQALNHQWVTLRAAVLAARNLRPALNRFRLSNAKRKFRHSVCCAAHLIYALTCAENDEETARAYDAAATQVAELQELNQGQRTETNTTREQVLATRGRPIAQQSSRSSGFDRFMRFDLVKTLEPGPRTYASPEHGIHLTVQPGYSPTPNTIGPIRLEHTARVVECEGKHYFMTVLVHCSPKGAFFTPPLLLDFLLDPDESSKDSKSRLGQVLEEYQVLHKGTNDTVWSRMPPKKLRLNVMREGDKKLVYLQAEVDHFCWFCCVREVQQESRLKTVSQRDSRSVIVRNTCEKTILLVYQFPSATTNKTIDRSVSASAPGVGLGARVGSGTTNTLFPSASEPSFTSILKGNSFTIDLPGYMNSVRLLMATKGGECSSRTGVAQGRGAQTLHLWDSINARGGRDIRVLPSFCEGEAQSSCSVPKEDFLNYKNFIVDLDKGTSEMRSLSRGGEGPTIPPIMVSTTSSTMASGSGTFPPSDVTTRENDFYESKMSEGIEMLNAAS